MRQALARTYARPISRPTAVVRSVPAPIGGLNLRDAYSLMKPTDAVILTNVIPAPGGCVLRGGSANHVTGITGPVETLMVYASGGTRKMFGAANNAFYDVSSAGAVGAAVDTGHTNNRWQYVNFGTAGGNFIIAVNGADTCRKYDGSSWSTNSITGPATPANLIHVNVFKQRLFFIEKNTLKFWYLPVSTISGAASSFDLASFLPAGGELQAMGTWTLDGGDGQDDYAVFLSTEGEIAIYRGTDPSLSSSWFLVGVYKIGRPVGRRCFCKIGSDLVVITDDGLVPLSQALITGRAAPKVAITDKVSGGVSSAVRNYRSNFGWQIVNYPQNDLVILNVPTTEDTTSIQYAQNRITEGWCDFSGWNAMCFEVFQSNLYFGTVGKVVKADTGVDDQGSVITFDIEPAFNSFGNPAIQKLFTMARPVFVASGDITPAIRLNVDYDVQMPTDLISSEAQSGAVWDTSLWDQASWGGGTSVRKSWQSVTALGYAGSLRLQISTKTITGTLQSIDYMFQPGGSL